MDRELAICGRGDFSLKRFLIGLASVAHFIAGYLLNCVGEAIRNQPGPLPPGQHPGPPVASGPLEIIHHDRIAELASHWLTLRQVIALPVLCISGMGHPVPAVACRPPSNSDLYRVGAAGVGLERLSQHQC